MKEISTKWKKMVEFDTLSFVHTRVLVYNKLCNCTELVALGTFAVLKFRSKAF